MNETGPVTTEIHESDRMFKNLVQFMQDEGFEDDQIEEIIENVKATNV